MRIYLAPLEGVTVSLYRNHYEKLYGNIDKYFAPFISPAEKCPLTPRDRKELLPENNSGLYLVPQILCNNSQHFNECVDELGTLGYKEFNLNLGCPSGTVCAKKKGSGFLTIPDSLKTFLDEIYDHAAKTNIEISLKTRLGYTDPDEFYDRNSSVGWVDKNGNKYKDWKAVVRTWARFRKESGNGVDSKSRQRNTQQGVLVPGATPIKHGTVI